MKKKNIIATKLKQMREKKDLEVSELAKSSGISEAHIYRIEAGERPNVSAAVLGQLADVLGTSVDFLMGRSDNPLPIPMPDLPALLDERFREMADWWDTRYDEDDRAAIYFYFQRLALKRQK